MSELVVAEGKSHSYFHYKDISAKNVSKGEKLQLALLGVISLYLRIKLPTPSQPLQYEQDIIKKVYSYMDGSFYYDINPPLVPLLYAQLLNVTGYSNYDFPLSLRHAGTISATIMVMFAYRTLRASGVRHWISIWVAALMAFSNGNIIQSRILSFDIFYAFTISLFLFAAKNMQIQQKFQLSWWYNLSLSAMALSGALSTHWSGIFIFIYAIYLIFSETFYLSSDLQVSCKTIALNFFLKLSSLSIPIVIYLTLWSIHFQYLTNVGGRYDSLSSEFQSSLYGNHLTGLKKDIYYGSQIMMRNYKHGTYLHSHNDIYRNGHQQVTAHYGYNDISNAFEIHTTDSVKNQTMIESEKLQISSPWRVRLFHKETKSYLSVLGDYKPPISEQEYNFEVTTDKNLIGLSEKSTHFVIRPYDEYCYKSDSVDPTKRNQFQRNILAYGSKFQIYHPENNCYVLANDISLTQGLGKDQGEIICIKEPVIEKSLWYIDWNIHSHSSGDAEIEIPKLNFWQKLWEVIDISKTEIFKGTKQQLLSDVEVMNIVKFSGTLKEIMLAQRGFEYLRDNVSHSVIYLVSNIIIHYIIISAVSIYIFLFILQIVVWNPFNSCILNKRRKNNFILTRQGLDYLVGFAIMLVPMKLVPHVFIQSSFPPLLFGLYLLGQLMEWTCNVSSIFTKLVTFIMSIFVMLAYLKFSPLIYGTPWTSKACEALFVGVGWNTDICAAYI